MCLQSLMKNGTERVYKSDNESPFQWWETHLKLPRFLLQRQKTPRLHVHAVSSECAFTALKLFPQRGKRKKVIPLFSLLCPSTAAHLLLNCLQLSPGRLPEEHYKYNSNTDVCLVFMQQSAESGRHLWWVFIRKSYLKWNLSWAACGKHCHVRETAKPYKAFPPKGST